MAKADADGSAGGRKRQLNIIYFVDSARTRSIAIPLGRLNVALGGALLLIAWSVASVFLVVWLVKGRELQAVRMRAALATIFEYETRDDKVFDIAYPQSPARDSAGVAVADAPSATAKAAPEAKSLAEPEPPEVAAAAANPPAEKAAAEARAPAVPPAEKTKDSPVQVGNPVLEAGDKSLQLRFDLTSHKGTGRIEGYIWAVAEFQSDSGEHLLIGAPSDIQVKTDGEPTYPLKSALFGIRRFKQKSFSFDFPKGKAGTFTGVKIGIMDRSGTSKTTYNVPVQIRVQPKPTDTQQSG